MQAFTDVTCYFFAMPTPAKSACPGQMAWRQSRGKEFQGNSASWNLGILIAHLLKPYPFISMVYALFQYCFIISAFKDWILT